MDTQLTLKQCEDWWRLLPMQLKNLHITSDSQNLTTIVPRYPWGIASSTFADTKIHNCSSPLYKIAGNNTVRPLCICGFPATN